MLFFVLLFLILAGIGELWLSRQDKRGIPVTRASRICVLAFAIIGLILAVAVIVRASL